MQAGLSGRLAIAWRTDVENSNAQAMRLGFDACIFDTRFLPNNDCGFSIGDTWWDLWFPVACERTAQKSKHCRRSWRTGFIRSIGTRSNGTTMVADSGHGLAAGFTPRNMISVFWPQRCLHDFTHCLRRSALLVCPRSKRCYARLAATCSPPQRRALSLLTQRRYALSLLTQRRCSQQCTMQHFGEQPRRSERYCMQSDVRE